MNRSLVLRLSMVLVNANCAGTVDDDRAPRGDASIASAASSFGAGGAGASSTSTGTVGVGGGDTIAESLAVEQSPRNLAVDATYVYWANYDQGDVARVPKTGGDVEYVATSSDHAVRIALNDDYVYWLHGGSLGQSSISRVAKA